MDLTDITSLADLTAALNQLRGDRSLGVLAAAAKKLPVRNGRQPALPSSTGSDLLNGKSVPTVETVVTFLAACGVDTDEAQRPWLAALERVAHQHQRRPPGAVRVREARPRLLGVHAAIRVDQPNGDSQATSGAGEVPPYVPRDLDADLRTKITVAGQRGGFVLLVGGSSVGKTRALFEAVRAVLPDWWLLHPADAPTLREFAAAPTDRTVVWLDELQRYLNTPDNVPAAAIRDLVNAGVVVVATLWPGEYGKRVALPENGQSDLVAEDRQLLGMAEVVTVPPEFSLSERRRAENLATDRRIRVALDTPDAGFTQVMAAGPELVRHWEQAPAEQCYGQAVITAALDARRVGAHAPLTRAYLEAAAPGYLTGRQQATAPAGWLDHALAYATTLLHGATATLCPVPAGMGRTAGYTVADYLHQHALRVRRTTHLPDTTWHALVQHHHPDDTYRLGARARSRGRDHEAETLWRSLADIGDEDAAGGLARLLEEQGRVEELTHRAATGDRAAARRWAHLLVEQGRVDEAIALLRTHADASDHFVAGRLADLLVEQGRVDEAIALWRTRVDAGDPRAAAQLADLLVEQGRVDEAIALLRTRADDADDEDAASRLVDLLIEQGQMEELTRRADAGDRYAASRLTDLLAQQGQMEELTRRADASDWVAAHTLADLLVQLGQLEKLTQRVDAGDHFAAGRLADLLVRKGRVDEAIALWRTRVDAGDHFAPGRLADLLVRKGRVDEAIALLHTHADAGNHLAAGRLVDLLIEQGRMEEVTHRAVTGDRYAAHKLADLLVRKGRVDEAIALLRTHADAAGDEYSVHRAADLLVQQWRVDEAIALLRTHADAGDPRAALRLTDLLVQQERVNETIAQLRSLADAGDLIAAEDLILMFARQGWIEELEAEVAAGTWGAVDALRAARMRRATS